MFEDYRNPNDYWMQRPQPGEQTDHDEAFNAGCFGAFFYIAALVVGMLICILFGSCKSVEYVFVPQTHTDTLIVTKVQHDSIYINDSTVITEKGDTVRIEKWHTKYVDHAVHDTVYQATHDTIPKPYPVIKEVEKPLSLRQKAVFTIGVITIIGVLCWIVWWVIKTLRRFGILRI